MVVGLFIWGFIQSFIVGIIIPTVRRAKNNYILSVIFIITALNILFQYLLRYENLRTLHPKFLILPDILDLILPVFVLIYINSIMGKHFTKQRLTYFILPTIWSVVLLVYVFSIENFNIDVYIGSKFHQFSLGIIFLWKLFILYKGIPLFKFKDKSLKQKQAALLLWPRVLVVFIGLLCFIALTNFFHWLFVGTNTKTVIAVAISRIVELNYVIFTCSIIFLTIYFSFKYPKILSGLPVVKGFQGSVFPEGEIYEKELKNLIYNKKIHLDTELNESKLAEALGVHSYILSKLLNDHIGKSFSEYINEKRIDEAKNILSTEKNKDLTVFAVAVDSGFRSESVFYINFKKFTNMTPTQYKKSILSKK